MHAILLTFLLLPGPLPASLNKCIGADGVASYQSLPCAAHQRTAWSRRSPPQAVPPPVQPVAAAVVPSRTRAPGPAARAVRPAVKPAPTRCAAARQAADLTRDRLWNRLSFRQRSDLDAKVALACAKR
ncbi:MAG: hypothetical protein K0M70_04170 [Arenimonas sp.]|uniref:hypothetical protein n=1 Tax=Arenimonas sp. TaxID=1872635 RepID=UPI0025BF7CA5|nr:hypothetical protein [Arenimonas sp.]MBW8367037.1 hypothetical protein [Arenimonas sp.]